VELYTKCQKARPNDFWANALLAIAHYMRKNPGESIRCSQAALAIRPDSAFVYNHLGLAFHDLNRFDEASDAFQAGLRVAPENSTSLANLGIALSFGGRHVEAIPKLRGAINYLPGEARLYAFLGYSLNAIGQEDAAWKNFKKAIELDPLFLAHWRQLRERLFGQQHFELARTLWREALATNPQQHDAWDGCAELSLFLGRQDEYRWARHELLNRFSGTGDPHVAERTGRACLFLPGTDDELRQAMALIGKALAADRSKLEPWVPPFFGFAEGLLAYRQGRFKESAAILKGDAGRVLGPAPGLVLAMDQYQLGEKMQPKRHWRMPSKPSTGSRRKRIHANPGCITFCAARPSG
jgi:serine/threonine-protein kinase